ncbi:MAG: hypothetical protein ACRDY3_05285 [Acidimicrobiales bacterium]
MAWNGPVSDVVRTRRLVVVDEEGRDRIVAEVKGNVAEVTAVMDDSQPGRTTGVALMAEERPEPGAVLGLHLSVDDDVIAEVVTHRQTGDWRVTSWTVGDGD